MVNRRKELIKEYKERKPLGGVYRIVNEANGKYFIDHSANIKSVQSHFQFAKKTGVPMNINSPLEKEWKAQGGETFELEILEEVEQGEDQTPAQFIEELKTLKELYRANFDSAKEY